MTITVEGTGCYYGTRFLVEVVRVTKTRITCRSGDSTMNWPFIRRNGKVFNAGEWSYYRICPADLTRIEEAQKEATYEQDETST